MAYMRSVVRRCVREAPRTRYEAHEIGAESTDTGDAATGAPDIVSDDTRASDIEPGDVDAVEEIGDQIATLAAHIHAATHRFLTLIARFDRLQGWVAGGHRTCAHWLAYRTGLDLGTAREHVRVARALEDLPRTGAAMARGALSFSQVRALSRVAEPSNEEDLLELAEGCTTAQLERLVRAWKKGSREDEAAWERERHLSRTFSVFPDDDGMYAVRGRLDPEVGALLMRALEAAGDALFRRDPTPMERLDSYREAARRRADAIGLLAERALAAGFRAGEDGDAGGAPISGTRAERYQVVLHVEAATLSADGGPGRSELEDGTRVSAETSRRLSCDASVVRIEHDSGGSPVEPGRILNVGRRTRTIPAALRRALDARDRGCRFPGCHSRFTDGHHIVHWADGGETSLANSVLLCEFHHRLVHEGGWAVAWNRRGETAFRDPRGTLHVAGRGQYRPARETGLLAALVRAARESGARPGAWTAGARWKREADIPDAVLFRAMEAALGP